jgi:hypothetical protein
LAIAVPTGRLVAWHWPATQATAWQGPAAAAHSAFTLQVVRQASPAALQV